MSLLRENTATHMWLKWLSYQEDRSAAMAPVCIICRIELHQSYHKTGKNEPIAVSCWLSPCTWLGRGYRFNLHDDAFEWRWPDIVERINEYGAKLILFTCGSSLFEMSAVRRVWASNDNCMKNLKMYKNHWFDCCLLKKWNNFGASTWLAWDCFKFTIAKMLSKFRCSPVIYMYFCTNKLELVFMPSNFS